MIVLSLVALCVTVRLLRLDPIEFYEDESSKWHFVRQWFYDNNFGHARWTHHMARFGMNVPVYFIQAVLGKSPPVYYVAPIAAFTLQVVFVYLIGRRLGGRAIGVSSAILLTLFTGMDRGACQLLPDGFGATALIAVAYCVVGYHDATDALRRRWLVAAGLAFVWGYSIKESNLLFLPGVLGSVWLSKRRWQDVAFLFAFPLLGGAIETAGFSLFTNYPHRLAIVQEAHGIETTTFLGLFDRFLKLERPWMVIVWAWIPSALWLAASSDLRVRMLVLIPASFLFLMTFLVRSVNPIVLWTRFQTRYFEAVGPFLALEVTLFGAEALRRLWDTYGAKFWPELPARIARRAVFVTVGACAALALVSYTITVETSDKHPLNELQAVTAVVNDAYRRNLPIVEPRPPRGTLEERRARAVKTVYGIYLSDRLIATSNLAKRGELPDILQAVQDWGVYSGVVRDSSVYTDDSIADLVDQGCAIVLKEREKSLTLERFQKLPRDCRAPRRPGSRS